MPLVRIDPPSGKPEYQPAAPCRKLGTQPWVRRLRNAFRSSPSMAQAGTSSIQRTSASGARWTRSSSRSPSTGVDADIKRAFRVLVEEFASRAGLRRSDVVTSLVEVAREDWSFGEGEAQLA